MRSKARLRVGAQALYASVLQNNVSFTREDGIWKGTSRARVQSLSARTARRTSEDTMPISSDGG